MFFNDSHPPDFELLKARYEPLSDDEFALLDEDDRQKVCLNSFVDFAYQILRIRPKAAAIPVRFYLNLEQRYLLFCLETQMRELGRVRLNILKSRQFGGSTLVAAWLYWMTIKTPGFLTFILSHEDKSTRSLFDMVELFFNESPADFRPSVDRSNVREMRFFEQHSGFRVGTAGAKSVGRSQTLNAVHWSEVAASQHADEHKQGLLQAVPSGVDGDGPVIIGESTARGVGGVSKISFGALQDRLDDLLNRERVAEPGHGMRLAGEKRPKTSTVATKTAVSGNRAEGPVSTQAETFRSIWASRQRSYAS